MDKQLIKQHNEHIAKVKASIPGYSGLQGREKFLADRRLGIGGSDVAAILGVHPHKTALEVWSEKTGRSESPDLSKNESVHFGIQLEDVIAKEYERRTRQEVRRVNRTLICKLQPWLLANLDRKVVGLEKVLEIKKADKDVVRFGKQWGEGNKYQDDDLGSVIAVILNDEVPDIYLLQCMHYMMVTGWKVADLAVLIGGNQYRDYTIKYNEQLANAVCQRLKDFWFNHVIADVAPEPKTLEDISMLHAKDNGKTVQASEKITKIAQHRKKLKNKIKSLEKKLDSHELEIKKFMGDNSVLTDNEDKKLYSWKNQRSKRLDVKALQKNEPVIAEKYSKNVDSRVFRA